jgi:hypothetical protein
MDDAFGKPWHRYLMRPASNICELVRSAEQLGDAETHFM